MSPSSQCLCDVADSKRVRQIKYLALSGEGDVGADVVSGDRAAFCVDCELGNLGIEPAEVADIDITDDEEAPVDIES